MTFSEVLTVFWRRKWIIIAVTILASMIAIAYLQRLTPNYQSTTTVRVSPTMTEAANSGLLLGVAVDIDPSVISTAEVLEKAVEALGAPAGALAGTISQSAVETASTTTMSFQISATASDPILAKQRAQAAAVAYSDYLVTVAASTQKALTDQLTDVSSEAKDYQAQIDKDPTDQLAQTNLTTSLARVNALNTSIASLQTAGPPTTITSAATVGESTNPTTLTVAGVSLASGLIAGMGIALIRDRFDSRIRRHEEMEEATNFPVLAQLPSDRVAIRKAGNLPAKSAESTALSEGLRSLRTTLQVALPGEAGVLVVTSVEPGDGKTFISANLAASWARTGRSVVLVAGDLRRPSLETYFPDSMSGPGLGGLLTEPSPARNAHERSAVHDALQPTDIDGLRILPPGEIRNDPADALASSRMVHVLSTLRTTADIVIIDTPPALALADASVVAAHADGTMVIATINRTKLPLLADVFTTLLANGATVLGTVANRSRRRLPRSYASYYLAEQRPAPVQSSGTRKSKARMPLAAPVRKTPEATPALSLARHDRVLIVCTANETRSPFAAALMRKKAALLPVDVDSAGTETRARGVSAAAALHAEAASLDLSSHTSAQFDPAALGDYDLILALSRDHARTLLASSPDIATRLFTVKQFARWLDGHERPVGISLGLWLDDESDQSALDFLGDYPQDDIADPTGRAPSHWRTMSEALDEAITDVLSGLYPFASLHAPVVTKRSERA